MTKTPRIYIKVMERMYIKSFEGKISMGEARHLLGWIFHLGREDIRLILKEMERYKLIKIPENAGGRYLFVLWTPKAHAIEDGEEE